MTSKFLLFNLLLANSLLFTACNPDDPEPPVESEVITTLNYSLTPSGGGDVITLSFQDLDGDDGNDPIITGGTLEANQSYTGSLELLNESETPTEDITAEIAEEDDEHQFFFSSSVAALSVTYTDVDGDGNPVGLSTTLTTGDAATGQLTVILRHEPSKSASGVPDGDITNAGGETDIEVTFPISVE